MTSRNTGLVVSVDVAYERRDDACAINNLLMVGRYESIWIRNVSPDDRNGDTCRDDISMTPGHPGALRDIPQGARKRPSRVTVVKHENTPPGKPRPRDSNRNRCRPGPGTRRRRQRDTRAQCITVCDSVNLRTLRKSRANPQPVFYFVKSTRCFDPAVNLIYREFRGNSELLCRTRDCLVTETLRRDRGRDLNEIIFVKKPDWFLWSDNKFSLIV